MSEAEKEKTNPADIVAAVLLGLGLAMGFLPITIASLIVKRNLFIECLDCMDVVWRSGGWQ